MCSGDAGDAYARLQLQMMDMYAELERNIIRNCQVEGIVRAKARGIYRERKATIDEIAVGQ